MPTVLLIWDYDTPTGFDVSHHSRHADPMSEYACTDRVLSLLAEYDIVSTFACVGVAAEPGPLPYHNPAQIRALYAAGHEIASHSHRHELIPTLTHAQLHETLTTSRQVLEDCIGAPVTGFVPPWNRPFHHPRGFSWSTKDWRDGRWRHSVVSLCAALAAAGYRWVRTGASPVWRKATRRFSRGQRVPRSRRPGRYHGVATFPNGYFGYDSALTHWLAQSPQAPYPLVVYAHPHGIEHDNAQHWRHLTAFAGWIADNRDRYNITFTTPSRWLDAHA